MLNLRDGCLNLDVLSGSFKIPVNGYHYLWNKTMKKIIFVMFIGLMLFLFGCNDTAVQKGQAVKFRRIPVSDYVDKMKAGWVGQMAGVSWGYPTEFKCRGKIMPPGLVPEWKPKMVNNAFRQDDLYVEMTFLRTLEMHGLNSSIRQAGIDFANSGYRLWWENKGCRKNLRLGIAPPSCSHPKFNKNADGIGYQIQSDFSGLISPGLPVRVIGVGEVFGRVTNYGDGLYAGQFMGGMYAEAFFETNIVKIVKAGLKCIPEGSQYHECISDVLKWYEQNPANWQSTWSKIENKYQLNPQYNRCKSLISRGYNIHAKLNGAYVVMGLLYGKGNPDQTIIISMRCGQDSDCNPSNAAGVLFTTMGYKKLPERFVSALNPNGKFSHTPYTFPRLTEVCEMLARKIVVAEGGRIEKDENGADVFVIPVQFPKPGKLEQSWEPGPDTNSKFTEAEMARIKVAPSPNKFQMSVAPHGAELVKIYR